MTTMTRGELIDAERQERASMRVYLDRKRIFDEVIAEGGYTPLETVILFHGYIGAEQHESKKNNQ
jgi:hypothetical protein